MNQQQIEQYVTGRMSEAEAEAFEEFCLENPEFAKQVEVEQRMKAGLAQVARGSTAEFVRTNDGGWKLAIAASVLLFVCAGIFFWQRSASSHPNILVAVAGDSSHVGPTMRLAQVRGAGDLPSLPGGMVRVEIVGLFESGEHYDVVLDRLHSNKTTETVAMLKGQYPGSSVSLVVLLDSDQLASGAYSLLVARNGSRDEPLEFGFVKP
jgi:hypothetical protein